MTNPSQPERYHSTDDEISLVDLAKILVWRWKALVTIFVLVVAGALAYALLMPRSSQYVSVYNVAEIAPTKALESPSSLVIKARNLYLGTQTRQLLDEQKWQRLPFEVEVNHPSDSLLVTLSSEAVPVYAAQVETLHQQVLKSLQQGQQALVERRRETLEWQVRSTNEALDALRDSDSSYAGELIATYTSRIADLEASLADLKNGEVAQVAVQSLEPVGTSRSLILALGIVLGGMLGVIGVFVLQFASLVCASLKKERESDAS